MPYPRWGTYWAILPEYSLMISIWPTMRRLNSASSSAGIQYSRWMREPAIWTGNCAMYSA